MFREKRVSEKRAPNTGFVPETTIFLSLRRRVQMTTYHCGSPTPIFNGMRRISLVISRVFRFFTYCTCNDNSIAVYIYIIIQISRFVNAQIGKQAGVGMAYV